MASLLLIRHGQALNAFEGDYDGLSEHGHKQAARLGEALKSLGLDLGRAVTGPRIRQKKTAAAAGAENAEVVLELDEHFGHDVVLHVVKNPPAPSTPIGRELQLAGQSPDRRTFAKAVAAILRSWAHGELATPVAEDFASFRQRVSRGLDVLRARAESDSPIVAFTSAGFIGAAVAQALSGDTKMAIELALQVDNASITELLFSRRDPTRLSLKRFNVVSHLQPDLVSYL